MVDAAIACADVWKLYGAGGRSWLAGRADPSPEDARAAGFTPAVCGVSLTAARGEMLVVMGLSGSGKSTLLRCMARLTEVEAGVVRVAGRDIGALSPSQLVAMRRETMGMVFQSFALLPHRTALENVAFPLEMRGMGRRARTARARDLLALVGLEGREDFYPREMSGGQQQRVGIARSLAIEPEIWFLDEPFSALDPLIRREMQDEFLRLKAMRGRTIVFVTHDFTEALRLADRIAIMKDGRIEQIDAPDRIVLAPATDYVARFTAEIDRAGVVRAAALAEPLDAVDADAPGPAADADATVRQLGRMLVEDGRERIPVVAGGALIGVMSRRRALGILLGDAACPSRSTTRKPAPRAGRLRAGASPARVPASSGPR
ncbi:ATP-binding cassette domain-containing protein [Rubrimonas cliftonensis]|uniref:Glycine betaine/proline transport system ATP-binding protein n=1 Tax=Rubrimonas cliftonensis TaxID=89524 RepID=A0A1H4G0A7_9RHOB|nr:ATP-binding cassette domain-containing protein [Rubrimonas cliftonensis]SEB02964.1 glycine betaine/proline transport system ATP-binding protein [Rubrimonas cliftonensis]